MAAILSQAFQIARDIIARDHIKDDIDAFAIGELARSLDKVHLAVIDCQIRTQSFGSFAFDGIAARCNHFQIKGFGKHDRHCANARSAAMDKQSLAIARHSALEHIVPHSEKRFRQRCCFSERHVFGNWQAMRPRRCAIFSIAAARCKRANFLPDHFRGSIRSHCNHFARNFQTQQRRCSGRRRVKPCALNAIRPVDACISGFDQHIMRLESGQCDLGQRKHIWPAWRIHCNRLHGLRQCIWQILTHELLKSPLYKCKS